MDAMIGLQKRKSQWKRKKKPVKKKKEWKRKKDNEKEKNVKIRIKNWNVYLMYANLVYANSFDYSSLY